jgi:hypothetical protein
MPFRETPQKDFALYPIQSGSAAASFLRSPHVAVTCFCGCLFDLRINLASLGLESLRLCLSEPDAGTDAERLRAETLSAQRFGFVGKLCIHPKQVFVVNESFFPSPEEVN